MSNTHATLRVPFIILMILALAVASLAVSGVNDAAASSTSSSCQTTGNCSSSTSTSSFTSKSIKTFITYVDGNWVTTRTTTLRTITTTVINGVKEQTCYTSIVTTVNGEVVDEYTSDEC